VIISWNRRTLGELCSFQRGLTYQKSDEVDVSSNIILRANNVDLATNSLNFDELKFIDDKVKIPGTKKVKKGALLICVASGSKSHLGKVAYIDRDYGYAFGGFMGMILPGVEIDPRYLFYLMTSGAYKRFISELSDGTNINNLKFDDLARFDVPFPPLPEQRRIVALLDEAFAGLETLRANAEKNLQNARELFESYLKGSLDDAASKHNLVKLDLICEFQNGFAFKSSLFRKEGEPILRISNIQNDEVIPDGLVYFNPTDYRENLDRYRVYKGDLLIAMSGATTGKIGFNNHNYTFYLNQRVGKFIPNEKLNCRFLFYYLRAKADENLSISAGAAQPNLITEQIRNFLIPLPPIGLQGSLVNEIDRISDSTIFLIERYNQKLQLIEELKQSLLHQAFSGQLKTSKTAAA